MWHNADMDDVLYQAIDERNWSTYRLSKESGVDWGAIRKWQAGDGNLSVTNLQKVAVALGFRITAQPIEDHNGNGH